MSPRREIVATGDSPAAGPGPEARIDPDWLEDDRALEIGIRPKRLADFVGQHSLREKLEIILEAARARQDHTGRHHGQRDGCGPAHHFGAGAGAKW